MWATTYHITYASAKELDDSILTVMQQVDRSVSAFNPGSIVSAVNAEAVPTAVADTILRRVFQESMRVYTLSGGVFDPTVGPLVDLWGFGLRRNATADSVAAPTDAAIDSARALVGLADCRLLADGRVAKKHPSTRFDFSAIAKGYACDLVAAMLRRNGVDDYLVEIGGEMCVRGENSRRQPWNVMIDAPIASSDSVIHSATAIIRLSNDCVATSGNYRNYHRTAAGTVGHTIDPASGRPAASPVLSVTIVAPECITADALATACMAMTLDSARAMLNRLPEASGLFVTVDADGQWELHPTRGFPAIDR